MTESHDTCGVCHLERSDSEAERSPHIVIPKRSDSEVESNSKQISVIVIVIFSFSQISK